MRDRRSSVVAGPPLLERVFREQMESGSGNKTGPKARTWRARSVCLVLGFSFDEVVG
jgi:hypothetical protein